MLNLEEIKKKSEGFIKQYNDSNILFSYISGSLIEGYGNENSDVDIFVITKNKEEVLLKEEVPEMFFSLDTHSIHTKQMENIRFDTEFYNVDEFEKIIFKSNSITYENGVVSPWLLENEYDMLHRFKVSVPLTNHDIYHDYFSKVNFNNFEKFNILQHTTEFGGLLDDLEGALKSKDYLTAYQMFSILFDNCIESFISSKNITNPKKKWIMKKMKDLYFQNNSLVDIYLDFKKIDIKDIENQSEKFIFYLNMCQSLNAESQKLLSRRK